MIRAILLATVGFLSVGLPPLNLSRAADLPVDFQRDVRPILSNSCFTCHGPDEQTREADLRLDVREGALASAIAPGQAAKSELLRRVTSAEADERMPPADSGRPALSADQVDVLRRWIDQGAAYREHWAYVQASPSRPEPDDPAVKASPIDLFVLKRLKRDGLALSSEADRRTLIRRLSLDLVGMPPTPDEVDAFVADKSADAYERLVDRLLASPHFGERMAIHWLDLVRYADTEGYHGDQERPHWLYRDYVIRSFNENKPFDQFTIEQLAGDLLPNPTDWQKIASGYNRLGMTTAEGGAQAKEYMAKYAADRVRNAGSVWLGSTVGCAECHDHKFDPYRTRDFYRFAAFFADVDEVAVGVQKPTKMLSAEQRKQVEAIDAEIAELTKKISAPDEALASAEARWLETASKQLPQWNVAAPQKATAQDGKELKITQDHTILAPPESPEIDTYTIELKTNLAGVTALRIETLTDASFPASGPGRGDRGDFAISEINVSVGKDQGVQLSDATADFSRDDAPASAAIDGDPKTAWDIHQVAGKDHRLEIQLNPPLGKAGQETAITITIAQLAGARKTLGKLRLSLATPKDPSGPDGKPLPSDIVPLLRIEPARRTQQQRDAITAHFRLVAPELAPVRQKLAQLNARREEILKSGDPVLVTEAGQPRVVRLLPRGNWLDESGEIVQPGVPAFLRQLDVGDRRATRLDLARWLVDPSNPLVARVHVNRLWGLMFGRGLVSTLDDFGSQGAPPSHPRLLDYLATEFVASGWDTKRLLKRIAMSATYRQTSVCGEELRRRDPANELLARQGRFRLPAEMVRDNALAASGLLVRKIGGPSAKPYQPEGYYDHLNFPKRVYQQDKGKGLYRRGLYTHWQRTFLHPSLLAFDAPSREECTVERPRSNTPLAALVLLNDPTYVEAARVLAAKAMQQGGTTLPDRLTYVYRQALQRPPRDDEAAVLKGLYEKHLNEYAKDANAAAALVSMGEARAPADIPAAELAAFTSVVRTVLNLHETINRN